MALIKCPECGREVSDRAAACIHCGCPISASRPKASEPVAAQKAAQPTELSLDFHAVMSGSPEEKTLQTVSVKQLGRDVQFSIPNNMKVGETIRVKLASETYSAVLFTVASISRVPAMHGTSAANAVPAAKAVPKAPAASNGSSYEGIKTLIKAYKPNWISQFFRSRRFWTIIIAFVGAIVATAESTSIEAALGMFVVFCGPLLAGYILYPMHHVKKYFKKYDIDDAIREDTGYMNVAVLSYNAMPTKKMIAYIRSLNPAAAKRVEQLIAESKKK